MAKSNGVLAWNRAIASAIRVWRSLPSPKSPNASTRTLRRLAPLTVNGGGASRRKWGRLWPAANTWWRSISRSIRSRAAGSRLPAASRPSSRPTTFAMAARRRMYAAARATSSDGSPLTTRASASEPPGRPAICCTIRIRFLSSGSAL